MNKTDYLIQLKSELLGMNEQELSDVLEYYSEYIDDSGCEDIISLLGPVQNVAAQIKNGTAIKKLEQEQKSTKKSIKTIWIVLICLAPVTLPLAIAGFAICFALIMVAFSLIIAVAAIIFAFAVSGLFSFIMSFIVLFTDFGVGISMMGGGMLLVGLSIVIAIPSYKFTRFLLKKSAALIDKLKNRGKIK